MTSDGKTLNLEVLSLLYRWHSLVPDTYRMHCVPESGGSLVEWKVPDEVAA